MTDKELLGAAAKAAGIELCWFEVPTGDPDCAPGWYCTNVTAGGMWDPATKDGDALRLAVKLGLGVLHHATSVSVLNCRSDGCAQVLRLDVAEGERLATTRRAIVRAAASMADSMTPNADERRLKAVRSIGGLGAFVCYKKDVDK